MWQLCQASYREWYAGEQDCLRYSRAMLKGLLPFLDYHQTPVVALGMQMEM